MVVGCRRRSGHVSLEKMEVRDPEGSMVDLQTHSCSVLQRRGRYSGMLCKRRSFSAKRRFCSSCIAGLRCSLASCRSVPSARMLYRRRRCRYTACMLAFGCCPGSRKRRGQRSLSGYLPERVYCVRQKHWTFVTSVALTQKPVHITKLRSRIIRGTGTFAAKATSKLAAGAGGVWPCQFPIIADDILRPSLSGNEGII